MNNRRAFTLIELLVVIAIIAILAAILFPVFAQAKAAAKKTTALSNGKQQSLSAIMYSGDADDAVVLNAVVINAAGDNLEWQDLIQPYAKNYGIVFDAVSDNQSLTNGDDYLMNFGMLPVASATSDGSYSNYLTRSSAWFQNYTAANLQYDGVAGFGSAGNQGFYSYNPKGAPSKSFTSIARPAEMAFTFDSNNWDGWHGIYGQQVGFGYCGGWAAGQGFTADYGFFGPQPRHTGGSNICDTNTRATAYGKGQEIVTFTDGHAKSMKAGEMMKQHGSDNYLNYWWPNA